MMKRRECAKCKGMGHQYRGPNGTLYDGPCDVCDGKGYVELTNVVQAQFAPNAGLSADDVLTQSMGQLDSVVIVGYDVDGNDYYNSNVDSGSLALWHLKRAIHSLMKTVDNMTGKE